MTESATAGNNFPPPDSDPLIEHLSELTDRLAREQRVQAITNTSLMWAEKGVHTEDQAAKIADNIKVARSAIKAFKQLHKTEKQPFRDAGKKVDQHFKPYLDALEKAYDSLNVTLTPYVREKTRKANIERERLEAIALEKTRQAEKMDAQANSVEEKQAAAAVRGKAYSAHAAARAETGHVHSDYGSTGHTQSRWAFEVEDFAKVPDEWKIINETKTNQAIRRRDNPIRDIPGLRIVQETKARVR